MLVMLVIGPSGVGKSACGEYAASAIPKCQFSDLDVLVRSRSGNPSVMELFNQIGPEAFFGRCQQEVSALLMSSSEGVALVAVGAGALEAPHAQEWLSQHPGPTIAVVAAPHEVHRRRSLGRTLAEFTAIEFSPHRQHLYDSAKYKCSVTGMSLDEAKTRFAELIREILNLK
jgi:shikimate kinase